MPEFSFSTTRNEEVIDITKQVQNIVKQSKLTQGLCFVFTPHATAAVIINENWDPNVGIDLLHSLSRIVPKRANYGHDAVDNNAAAHIKSAMLGPSETLTFKNSELFLGQWQSIMFCEFDGPRQKRRIMVDLIGK